MKRKILRMYIHVRNFFSIKNGYVTLPSNIL
jgi:hypothetical protein